jgi:hypothetical protein
MATTPLVRRLAPGLDASAAGSGAGQAVAPVETVR